MMLKWSLATDITNVGQINIILDHIAEFSSILVEAHTNNCYLCSLNHLKDDAN